MYGYVYIVANIINNKLYIGRHKWNKDFNDFKDRPSEEDRKKFIETHGFDMFPIDNHYLGSGTDLLNDILTHGKDKFYVMDILDIAHSHEELMNKEHYWIEQYMKNPNFLLYNKTTNGRTGFDTSQWDKSKRDSYLAFRRRLAIERNYSSHFPDTSGKNNPNYGKHASINTRLKISKANRGRIQSLEERERRSKAHDPNNIPPNMSGRIVINNGVTCIKIFPDELAKYPGWKRGYLKRRKL